LTVVGKHLQCDFRDTCVVCSNYTWPPNAKQSMRYYHCKYCYMDILCHLGLTTNFEYEDSLIQKIVKCSKCGETVEEKIWPEPKK